MGKSGIRNGWVHFSVVKSGIRNRQVDQTVLTLFSAADRKTAVENSAEWLLFNEDKEAKEKAA